MNQIDEAAAANTQQIKAYSIRTLVDAGFDADAVVEAVTTNDLTRLKGKHRAI